jgi:hypothetical protein
MEMRGNVMHDCETVFNKQKSDLVMSSMMPNAVSMTREQFKGACFLKQGSCCEALCRNGLRCHNDARFNLRVKYDESTEGSCFRVPKEAITDERFVQMGDGERDRHTAVVKVCVTHHKTLTDAIATGSRWQFLRWVAFASGAAVCAYVVVPVAMGYVAAAVTSAAVSAGIPTMLPLPTAIVAEGAIAWAPMAVSGGAWATGAFKPMTTALSTIPGRVNQLALSSKNVAFRMRRNREERQRREQQEQQERQRREQQEHQRRDDEPSPTKKRRTE